uniref:Uncharacterized protein n=1 Tax=Meloidogyne enterolobii TaxID=390850 RepID=A0A6V7VJ36_MELEN|nr:unnamed protein product [Meloidogyne enterolobii]
MQPESAFWVMRLTIICNFSYPRDYTIGLSSKVSVSGYPAPKTSI